MTTASSSTCDAVQLPLVAYRGLWDKFASPGSAGAVRRAYRRGVPSLIRVEPVGVDRETALEFVTNPDANHRGVPSFFVTDGPPTVRLDLSQRVPLCRVFAIDADAPQCRTRPIYEWRDDVWTPVGCYLTLAAIRRGLAVEDIGGNNDRSQLVLFESVNLADELRAWSASDKDNDDATLATIRALAHTTHQIMRVSDLVECDQLILRNREAA